MSKTGASKWVEARDFTVAEAFIVWVQWQFEFWKVLNYLFSEKFVIEHRRCHRRYTERHWKWQWHKE